MKIFILGEADSSVAKGRPFDPGCRTVWNLASLFGYTSDRKGAEDLRKALGEKNFANAYPGYRPSKKLRRFAHRVAPSRAVQQHLGHMWKTNIAECDLVIVMGVFAHKAVLAFDKSRDEPDRGLSIVAPETLALIDGGQGPTILLLPHTSQRSFRNPERRHRFEAAKKYIEAVRPRPI
jgi:hypothetical protein